MSPESYLQYLETHMVWWPLHTPCHSCTSQYQERPAFRRSCRIRYVNEISLSRGVAHLSSSLPPVVLTSFTLIGKSLVDEACTLNRTDVGFEPGPALLCRTALTTGPTFTLHCGFCRKVGDVQVPPLFLEVNSICNYYAPQHGGLIPN